MEEIIEVQALREKGLEGGAHARGGKRQILLVDGETLDAMNLRSGALRENITTEGLNVNSLAPGQQLLVGNARLEVSMACTPCDQLERVRPGLRKELWGRRGILCRVIESGTIRRGDLIEKLAPVREPIGRANIGPDTSS
jgi:MOSC domain-containing protein YiiM